MHGMQVVSRSNVAWACAQEALRLKPPVKLYFRTAQEDCVVGDVAVPSGTTISLCVRQSIRETGSKTRNFEPEQWLIKNDAGKTVFDFTGEGRQQGQHQQCPVVPNTADVTGHKRIHGKGYLPFSRGKRKCLGEHFAMSELVVSLMTMARHVKTIDMSHEESTREYFVIGPHPTGLPVTFVPRDRSEIPAHVPQADEQDVAPMLPPSVPMTHHSGKTSGKGATRV